MHTIATTILLVVGTVVGFAAVGACFYAANEEDRRWAERQKQPGTEPRGKDAG